MISLAQILGAVPAAHPIQVYHGGQQMDELARFNAQKAQLAQSAQRENFQETQQQYENKVGADREATRQSELGAATGENRRRYDATTQDAVLSEVLPLLNNPDTMHIGLARLRQAGFGVDTGEKPVAAPKPYMPQPAGESVSPDLSPQALPQKPQDQPAPALRLGDVGGGLTSISNPAGKPLASVDYGAMHSAQVQRAQAELDQLVATAGPIDENSSAQARAMIPQVLASNGYNTKAAAQRVYETFYKRQALEHGDIRAQEMAGLGRERIAASAHRGGENIQLKQWAQGEASAHRTWTTQQAQQHIGQYRSVNDALGKLAANPTNPATYASVIYAMAKSNDARGVVTNRDFDVAAGVTDLAGQGEEKIAQWFAGEAGRAHLPQILEYLKKQKQVTELNSLKDAEALAKQYREQPSQTHRRAFGSVLDRFAEMPFFPALVKELDMAGAVQEPMMDGSFDESSSSSVETEDTLRSQGLLP